MNAQRCEPDAFVTDIRLESRGQTGVRWQIALDRTVFSESLFERGFLIALSPSGMKLEVPVLEVFKEDETVWHVVEKPLATGTRVAFRSG